MLLSDLLVKELTIMHLDECWVKTAPFLLTWGWRLLGETCCASNTKFEVGEVLSLNLLPASPMLPGPAAWGQKWSYDVTVSPHRYSPDTSSSSSLDNAHCAVCDDGLSAVRWDSRCPRETEFGAFRSLLSCVDQGTEWCPSPALD